MEMKDLETTAENLIKRLFKVIEEQKQTIAQYEGAIEGVKLFLQELRKTIEDKANGQSTGSTGSKSDSSAKPAPQGKDSGTSTS